MSFNSTHWYVTYDVLPTREQKNTPVNW